MSSSLLDSPATDGEAAASSGGWPVFGHDWAVTYLRGVVQPNSHRQRERLRHAYLFTGPAELGKSTLARCMAATLLCPHARDAACGDCRSCRAMTQGQHPDFLLVDPVDGAGEPSRRQGMLRVEQTETIGRFVILRPFESEYRVVLIRDLQQANPVFLNRLLKTFEEPPAQVILLATVTDADRILPTLVSRCQLLALRPVNRGTIHSALRDHRGVAAREADLLARLAHGRIGWAFAHCQDQAMWKARDQALDLVLELARASTVMRLAKAEEMARARTADPERLTRHLEFWLYWWRDVWLMHHNGQEMCHNVDRVEDLDAIVRSTQPDAVMEFLRRLEKAQFYLRGHVNPRLVLTHLMLYMPSPSST